MMGTLTRTKPTSRNKRKAAIAFVGLLGTWLLWALITERPFVGVSFEWDSATGFRYSSIPCRQKDGVSGSLIKMSCWLVAKQSQPFIAHELRKWGWKRASGVIAVETIKPLPLVLGLDRLANWEIVDPEVSPLMRAAETGDIGQVRQLMKAGADINARDQRGFTALMHACMSDNSSGEIVKTLLEARANVNAMDKFGRNSLLWSVFNGVRPAIVKELVSAGADVNVRDREGNPVLLNAVASGPEQDVAAQAVRFLVEGGADLRAKDPRGETALALAKRIGRLQIAELLEKAGAKA